MAVCWLAGLLSRRLLPPPFAGARARWLDGLRGVAAVSVLTSHVGHVIADGFGLWPAHLFHNLGTFGVQVFFAITGYLFTRKAIAARGHLDIAAFLSARLRRIVPMYSVAIALGIAIACVVQSGMPAAPGRLLRDSVALYAFGFVLDGSPSIRGLHYTEFLGPIWSLSFEWLFYLCVPVLAVLVQSRRTLALTGAVLAIYYGSRMAGGALDVFTPFFLPGVAAALLPAETWPPRLRLAGGAVALVLALAAVLPGTQNFTAARLALMMGFFLAAEAAAPDVLARPSLTALGDLSYSLYLLHFPALFVTRAILDSPRVALTAPWPRACGLLAMAGAVTVLSAVTHRWIERPFLRRGAV